MRSVRLSTASDGDPTSKARLFADLLGLILSLRCQRAFGASMVELRKVACAALKESFLGPLAEATAHLYSSLAVENVDARCPLLPHRGKLCRGKQRPAYFATLSLSSLRARPER